MNLQMQHNALAQEYDMLVYKRSKVPLLNIIERRKVNKRIAEIATELSILEALDDLHRQNIQVDKE